jgi:hypothetical protein
VCTTAEHGYSVGDKVCVTTNQYYNGTSHYNITLFASGTNALGYTIASSGLTLLDRTAFTAFPITVANWNLFVVAKGGY